MDKIIFERTRMEVPGPKNGYLFPPIELKEAREIAKKEGKKLVIVEGH